MEKYVTEQLDVSQGALKLNIQSHLDMLKFIDHHARSLKNTS